MSIQLGIQLYGVRDHLETDPVSTIRKTVGMGYRNLEAANGDATGSSGFGLGMDAPELKALLDELGAVISGAHIRPFDSGNAESILAYCRGVGCRDIIIPIDFFRDETDLAAKCRQYNEMGRLCEAEGMRLLYHNHYHEFQQVGGESILDIIAESTDSRYLNFEIDTFWALRAGRDPVQVLRHYGSRVKRIHIKDFALPGETTNPLNLLDKLNRRNFIPPEDFSRVIAPEDFVEIGTGRLDIQQIVDAASALGTVDLAILEQDYSAHDSLESIRISMEGLKAIQGLER